MAEEKAVALYEPEGFAVMEMEQQELQMILDENLGGEALRISDLTRVNVPGSGGKIWSYETIDGEFEGKELIGVIIFTKITRSYWTESFSDSGGGSAPDCFSPDGKNGIGEMADKCGGKCADCPMNEFGSDPKGKGRACKENRLIFMLTKDDVLPIVIKAPVMSLSNARKYLVGLMSRRKAVHSVYTSLALEQDKNEDGIKYSKITFSKVGDVEQPEVTRAYATQMRPYLDQMANAISKESNGTAATNYDEDYDGDYDAEESDDQAF